MSVATTKMKSMTIYFVAGEVSADNHGAALMRSLRELNPEVRFVGRGGPQMEHVAGASIKNWIGDAAVLGLWEVLRKYGYFREQFQQTLVEILESKPDAVVLIDYPGFNLRLASALRCTSATLLCKSAQTAFESKQPQVSHFPRQQCRPTPAASAPASGRL